MKLARIPVLVLLILLAGCRMQDDVSPPGGSSASPAPVPPPPSSASPRVRLTRAQPGDVAPIVKAALTSAGDEGRRLLVYEGATWCEPCQKFHHAVERGELDDAFPKLTLLEFDADQDHERLATAGYASRYIPLFAVPSADGSSSGEQVEGSVKGDAVADLTPRLRELLSKR